MKQSYVSPELEVIKISSVDILAGSGNAGDTLVNGSDLFGTTSTDE